jgi:hypothetical protein
MGRASVVSARRCGDRRTPATREGELKAESEPLPPAGSRRITRLATVPPPHMKLLSIVGRITLSLSATGGSRWR